MVKCSICGSVVPELFLEKIKGTVLRQPGSKKQYPICFACQKKWPTKEELLAKVK
ncbi:hypothetical protein J4210_02755 [Candidatus Woesearchaeota archaeon]|nr:hypothetical protein [Candidatus Woesearchaeota archaeon]